MSNSEESSLGKVLKEISGLIGNFPELSLELNNIKNAPNTSMMQGMYDALKRNNPNLPSLLFDTENLVPSSTEKETKKENPEESLYPPGFSRPAQADKKNGIAWRPHFHDTRNGQAFQRRNRQQGPR